MLNDKKKIVVSTGNVLSVNKKAGQKTNEEVSGFCLLFTLVVQCSFFSSRFINHCPIKGFFKRQLNFFSLKKSLKYYVIERE